MVIPVNPSDLLQNIRPDEQLPTLTSLHDSLASDRFSEMLKSPMRGTPVSMLVAAFVPYAPMLPIKAYFVDIGGCPADKAAYQCIADHLSSMGGTRLESGEVVDYLGAVVAARQASKSDAVQEMIFTAHAMGTGSLVFLLHARGHGWQAEVAQRLKIAAPLLVELAGAEWTKRRASRRLSLLESALDEVSIALFMLDARARPFCLNAAAFSRLAMADAFRLTRLGTLSCIAARDTLALHDTIRSIIGTPPSELHEKSLVIGTRNGERAVATLRSVRAQEGDAENRAVLLLIQHEVRLSRAALDALGLTASEQRFLSSFLYCSSLSIAAGRLNLSDETARTYLKRICAKLGVRKQVELAAFVWNLSLPLRRTFDIDASPPGTLGMLSQSANWVG